MALKSISAPRRRLADEVYEQLVNAIVNREIGPEDRLVQEKIAAELEISRTPVREALLRLEAEGVLSVANSGGFRLSQMSEEETLQLYQARTAIEGQAARILAAHADKATLDALRGLIQREEALENPTTRDYFMANRNIHRALMEATGNKFMLEMFDVIWSKARAFHLFAAIENADLSKSLGDHLSLVDAIETGDRGHALEVLTAHIQSGFDLHVEGIRKTPIST